MSIANERGESALTLASGLGRVDLVRALIAAGVDVNHATNWDESSLMKASESGHVAVVRVLITAGATIDHANNNG